MWWSATRLEAEELAARLAISTAWLSDAGFDVWTQVRSRLDSAFAKRIADRSLAPREPGEVREGSGCVADGRED